MKNIRLTLPTGEDASDEEICTTVDCDSDEVALLRRFVALMERVRDTPWLRRGMSGFEGLTFDDSGLTLKAGECSDAELHALLHVLRPVTLERELSGYQRAAAVLGRRIGDPRVRAFLKACHRAFQDGEMSMYMQITIGSQKLFDKSLLDTWLNGTQYHSEPEKAEAWNSLERSLCASNSRAVVVAQLHSKVTALLNVDYMARQVLAVANAASPL
jgi:hypothetical protein